MKVPEREIQKSLSILKAHRAPSALQKLGKSVSKQTAVKKGAVSLLLVWEVYKGKTQI